MRIRRTLKSSLFISPSLIIIGAFAIILLAFNIIVSQYTNRIASEHIHSQFSTFSLYSKNEENWWKFTKNESGYGLTTAYVVLDESEKAIDPSPPWPNPEEEAMTEYITSFYQQNRHDLRDGKMLSFTHESQAYRIQMGTYYGYYDGYMIFEDEKNQENHQYDILVFTNVTPLVSFGATVNQILWILMAGVLLLTLFLMFLRSYKLDAAFKALNAFIFRAGNRETLPRNPAFVYKEFYQVARTILAMIEMINQAENAQKQFFANASHELKTPLMSIQGYAEGLQSGVIKDQEKCLSVIIHETQKMALLINDILLLSRMDAANHHMPREVFDLRELVLYCTGTIETTAQKNNIALQFNVADTPIPCCGDESEMERAVLNILTNALRYAKTVIHITCRQTEEGAIITIEDDGTGISLKDLPHIFERFYKGSGGNFGIGLSIAQEVVQQHHGKITVDSSPGKTIFRILLPVHQ